MLVLCTVLLSIAHSLDAATGAKSGVASENSTKSGVASENSTKSGVTSGASFTTDVSTSSISFSSSSSTFSTTTEVNEAAGKSRKRSERDRPSEPPINDHIGGNYSPEPDREQPKPEPTCRSLQENASYSAGAHLNFSLSTLSNITVLSVRAKKTAGNFNNQGGKQRFQQKQAEKISTFRLFSLGSTDSSSSENESIDFNITFQQDRPIGWSINDGKGNLATINVTGNPDIQMIYDSNTSMLEVMTSQDSTDPIKLASISQVIIGDELDDLGISIEYFTICKHLKPEISTELDVRNESLTLTCIAKGLPFLMGYWKRGDEKIESGNSYNGTRLEEEGTIMGDDLLEELSLTLEIPKTELQRNWHYHCHTYSLFGKEEEVSETLQLGGVIYWIKPEPEEEESPDGGDNEDETTKPEKEVKKPLTKTEKEKRKQNIAVACVTTVLFFLLLGQIKCFKIHQQDKERMRLARIDSSVALSTLDRADSTRKSLMKSEQVEGSVLEEIPEKEMLEKEMLEKEMLAKEITKDVEEDDEEGIIESPL